MQGKGRLGRKERDMQLCPDCPRPMAHLTWGHRLGEAWPTLGERQSILSRAAKITPSSHAVGLAKAEVPCKGGRPRRGGHPHLR